MKEEVLYCFPIDLIPSWVFSIPSTRSVLRTPPIRPRPSVVGRAKELPNLLRVAKRRERIPPNRTEPANQGRRRWTSLPFRWTPNLRKCDRRNSTTAPLPPSSLPSIAARIASSHLPNRRRKSFLPHSLPQNSAPKEKRKSPSKFLPRPRSKDPSSCPPLYTRFSRPASPCDS